MDDKILHFGRSSTPQDPAIKGWQGGMQTVPRHCFIHDCQTRNRIPDDKGGVHYRMPRSPIFESEQGLEDLNIDVGYPDTPSTGSTSVMAFC